MGQRHQLLEHGPRPRIGRGLVSPRASLGSVGIFTLHVTLGEDGLGHATLETEAEHPEPETNIASILTAVESLEVLNLNRWDNCTLREFNIGYDCGAEPWAFNQRLSPNLLGRMAAALAALRTWRVRMTLYRSSSHRDSWPTFHDAGMSVFQTRRSRCGGANNYLHLPSSGGFDMRRGP